MTVDEKIHMITRNLDEVMGGQPIIESMRKALTDGKELRLYWYAVISAQLMSCIE